MVSYLIMNSKNEYWSRMLKDFTPNMELASLYTANDRKYISLPIDGRWVINLPE